jgi:hypothetical protein
MGNKQSAESSDFYDSQVYTSSNMLQTGGNKSDSQNVANVQNKILNLDLSDLYSDSENENDNLKYGGYYNNFVETEDTVRTEDFVNLLKSKIANLSNQNSQVGNGSQLNHTNNLQTLNLSLSESDFSDTSVFLSTDKFANSNAGQIGGNVNTETEVDTIMRVARDYLRQHRQHGGGSEDSDEEDSDEELEDSDEDSESEDNKAAKRSTKPATNQAKAQAQSQAQAKSDKAQKSLNKMSESVKSDTAVSSESVSSDEYTTGSSETFGGSSVVSSDSSGSKTPYIESESINTSSINLVSFENPALKKNPALTKNLNKKSKQNLNIKSN